MLCPGGVPPENILCKLHNGVFSRPHTRINTECFLPTREGVSGYRKGSSMGKRFPPYTGGCIGIKIAGSSYIAVSSLHGRVYLLRRASFWQIAGFLPTREGVSQKHIYCFPCLLFPPYTGGCIERPCYRHRLRRVSSLHGRVYRIRSFCRRALECFLPTREGVSAGTSQGCAISRRGENPTKNLFMIRAARPGFFVLGYGIRLRYLFFISMSSICSDIAATVFKTETGFLPAKNIATCAMYSSLVMAETKVRAYCVLD